MLLAPTHLPHHGNALQQYHRTSFQYHMHHQRCGGGPDHEGALETMSSGRSSGFHIKDTPHYLGPDTFSETFSFLLSLHWYRTHHTKSAFWPILKTAPRKINTTPFYLSTLYLSFHLSYFPAHLKNVRVYPIGARGPKGAPHGVYMTHPIQTLC